MSRFALWAVPVALIAVYLLMGVRDGDLPATKEDTPLRVLRDALMVERNRETGKAVRIAAAEVTEGRSGMVSLRRFTLEQEQGAKIGGEVARYDMNTGTITMDGPVTVTTPDGIQASLNGLVWDRKGDVARTEGLVSLAGAGSRITAKGAEFKDGFSRIILTGGVHAEIRRDILDL